MNKPSWSNSLKYDKETSNTGTNFMECRPYMAVIKGVIDRPENNYMLICFDIVEEGSKFGCFSKEFIEKNGASNDMNKWNFNARYFLPYDENSQPEFERVMTAIMKSNSGFTWDWNEQSLVGKKMVVVYGEAEYCNKRTGQKGIGVVPRMIRSVPALLENKIKYPLPIKKMKDSVGFTKPQQNQFNTGNAVPSRQYNNQPQFSPQVSDEDLPF